MKKILRTLMIVVMALTIIVPALSIPASAATINVGLDYAANTGLGNKDPRAIAASIIQIALGFLGIIAVVIILIGGFKWMTAAGNEEGVSSAQKILVAGVIGLVIILAAWGIANFVLNSLLTATNNV